MKTRWPLAFWIIALFSPTGETLAQGERVDVDKIKEKYWAKGDEAEMGVVQNRTYTKANRFELGVFAGVQFGDPFLTITPVGTRFGYHFSELFALNVMYMRLLTSGSTALEQFQQYSGGTANTNEPSTFYGGEGTFSLIYGKLSLLGASILYYDLHLSSGIGVSQTETGSYITPTVGVGQRFFMSKNFSLRVDYRLSYYRDEIREKTITTQIGTSKGSRNYFGNTITMGVDFFFGGGGKQK